MSVISIVPHIAENTNPAPFDAAIRVAGLTIAPSKFDGDRFPSVAVSDGDKLRHFTPIEALALASALQAVGVYLMEQEVAA